MAERGGSHRVPKSLPDFQHCFPNEEACVSHLYAKRFPDGFVCHYCEEHEGDAGPPYTFAGRPTVYRCRNCKRDTSLTAGTIMHRSKQPLCTWFWAAFLVTGLSVSNSQSGCHRELDQIAAMGHPSEVVDLCVFDGFADGDTGWSPTV